MQQIANTPASTEHKQLILIDTDIGDDIDDALALALALQSPELTLTGVTTVFGDTHRRAQLAAHLLHIFGRADVPVAAGIGTPLQPRQPASGVPQALVLDSHKKSSSKARLSPLSAPDLIIQQALTHPGQLTLLCIGPLTNIATALLQQPQLKSTIRSIILLGGTGGLPFPEWNIRSDARAAQIVLSAGIPLKLIGWNVTTRCQLRRQDIIDLYCAGTPQTQLLSQMLDIWQYYRPRWHPRLPYVHDPLTLAALCKPALLRFEPMHIRIVCQGPFKGWAVPRLLAGPLVQAAVAVDAMAARQWIMGRLLTAGRTDAVLPGK